ncbi:MULTISPECIES: DUF4288 domain-containing protein [Calothrix]|uniref:DUF4288 domain-containing protein n=2 Tax=Calothrix TaxID=1186 RepID=A0ABR8A5I5_9CYAN|nr:MULTISPECIES: DUF4288 domain-containing protein [Calothrix]MBD2194755.1 DUF4288 domain-containing protein [Calothrix parietina FACHB-288]MBD2225095.1 DUF4288 domain-containing protein [Calothrix anomala FACHB-343]
MTTETTNKLESFYIAIILYKSSSDTPDYQPLYQESFVLIKAASLESAKDKALNHGNNESVSYTNENGETITWTLQQVVDVNSVLYDDFDSSEDVVDLYTRHFRNYEAYRSFEPLLSQEQY